MERKHELIESGAMERRMHLWRYGHFGPPLLVFPSASGMAHEWQMGGAIDALAPWLDAGRFKLYCVESNVSDSWLSNRSPAEKLRRHASFEGFLLDELVPLVSGRHHVENGGGASPLAYSLLQPSDSVQLEEQKVEQVLKASKFCL